LVNTQRVAVITGAAQGIGRRTAEVLAERGYALALNDIHHPDDALDAVRRLGAEAISAVGDVSDEQAVQGLADHVLAHFGRVDVLVNNAGISFIAPAEAITADHWRRVMDVNLLGPFLLSQAFGRHMLARREGSIVNVASIAGLLGIADRAAYNASKHGPIGLTRTLGAEWGGRGVRVNASVPAGSRPRWMRRIWRAAPTRTPTSRGVSQWAASHHRTTSRRPSPISPTRDTAGS